MDKGMSKEKINQIIDEVYERYSITAGMSTQVLFLTRGWFIHYIKTDVKFSETWGLKIEERELSLEERYNLIERDKHTQFVKWQSLGTDRIREVLDSNKVPTKLITIIYNNEKIESYE